MTNIAALEARIAQLQIALSESVKLQSHYAGILNDYDGGQRRSFSSADEWIKRLIETKTIGADNL